MDGEELYKGPINYKPTPICQASFSLSIQRPEWISLIFACKYFSENDTFAFNLHQWETFFYGTLYITYWYRTWCEQPVTSVIFSCYWSLYVNLRQVFLLSKISESSTARSASISEDIWKWRGDRERIWVQPRVCTLTDTATGAAGRSHSQAVQGCSMSQTERIHLCCRAGRAVSECVRGTLI